MPGGRVEEFESILDALKREVLEETGLTLTYIEGMETKVNAQTTDADAECVQPFAAYQTTRGRLIQWAFTFVAAQKGTCLKLGTIQ